MPHVRKDLDNDKLDPLDTSKLSAYDIRVLRVGELLLVEEVTDYILYQSTVTQNNKCMVV